MKKGESKSTEEGKERGHQNKMGEKRPKQVGDTLARKRNVKEKEAEPTFEFP